jgi:hypothetical protein
MAQKKPPVVDILGNNINIGNVVTFVMFVDGVYKHLLGVVEDSFVSDAHYAERINVRYGIPTADGAILTPTVIINATSAIALLNVMYMHNKSPEVQILLSRQSAIYALQALINADSDDNQYDATAAADAKDVNE